MVYFYNGRAVALYTPAPTVWDCPPVFLEIVLSPILVDWQLSTLNLSSIMSARFRALDDTNAVDIHQHRGQEEGSGNELSFFLTVN